MAIKTELDEKLERDMVGGGRAGWEAREFRRKYQNKESDEDETP